MKYKLNKGFIFQKFGGKTIIFDIHKSVLYTFNEVASFIFENIRKAYSDEKIVHNIVRRYQIKEKKAKADLREIISDLMKNKIISLLETK